MRGREPIAPKLRRRIPPQFSWVDHRLVRDGHIRGRSAEALALLNVPRLGMQRVSLTPSALLASRRIDPKVLVEGIYPLSRAPEAFEHAGSPGALKVLLDPTK